MKTIALVIGGARSGKSWYAQQLAAEFKKVTFIATAQPADADMRRKIATHREERPAAWKTVEAPMDLPAAMRKEGAKADVLLIDCLTVYLANVMGIKRTELQRCHTHILQIGEAFQSTAASVIAVSNEVGSGIVPAYRSGRIYRDLLGQLNQEIAKIADRVILMVAGLPLAVKEQRVS
ncbi:MAG TPA: bifunctional adenosylcobinamide kinase/adenosylcobinamide-phosphate guanylyltransferase [Terriglobia bacterium]|nr:bifunctional adenosylcobinamide kinase/adenosylcobinamide-phosphate guanylyltransferase [Terriglobia bacterium]